MSQLWTEQVAEFLREKTLPSEKLLVAVSGGADSVGLFTLLTDELGIDPERLTVGHVDHGIREDSFLDRELIRKLAESRSVKWLWRQVDAPGFAEGNHFSLEAAARKLRYQALGEMADEAGCQWILTAHTLDDSAETVLMRLQGGARWYECTAIPAQRGKVLRPLIGTLRQDVRLWITKNNTSFREDESNKDLRYQRNKLRSELVKCPEFWTEGRKRELAEAGTSIGESLNELRKIAETLYGLWNRAKNLDPVCLAIDENFQYFHRFSFIPIEAAWATILGVNQGRLPSAIRRQISDCVRGSSPKAKLKLPGGVELVRDGKWVMLRWDEPVAVHQRVFWGENRVSSRNLVLRIEKSCKDENSNGSIAICVDFLNKEFYLRNWQAGDRMKMRGRPEKKIADLLAEKKLNPWQRARVLVLTDDAGPILLQDGRRAEQAIPNAQSKNVAWITWDDTNDYLASEEH